MAPDKTAMDGDSTNISQEQLKQADIGLVSRDEDTCWQAAILLGEFSETDPEAIWPLTVKYGSCPDVNTRTAIATCVLEHILEYHFEVFISRVQQSVREGNSAFADTFLTCWQFGDAKLPGNSEKFKSLTRQAEYLWQSRRRKRTIKARSPKQKAKQEWRQARNKTAFRNRLEGADFC